MAAGKVRLAMGLQKSPARSKQEMPPKPPLPSPSSGKLPQKASISRSFGMYFPRSSAQVQPRPPDVTELLRLVEELRERESLLKIELLEYKLLKESVTIVPVLENEVSIKDAELHRASKQIVCLEIENQTLRMELESLNTQMDNQRREDEEKIKAMEVEISELKRKVSDCYKAELLQDNDELSSSQRFQGLMEVSIKSNLIKNLKKGTKCMESSSIFENQKLEGTGSKKEVVENERPRHSRCNSEDLTESFEPALSNLRSRPPRVPKPPPRPSSSTLLVPTSSDSKAPTEQKVPLPPPPPKKMAPPPPPPPPRGLKGLPNQVRRVPEVVEFYHSLMRRDSRKDSSATATTSDPAPATANTRDMIGEIENRSTHLIAIKSDVETQGDFIRFLIREVENAAFMDIEDVVPFVKWLDDELSYLVDERAVLKHFNWPEQKADALREAAFGYADLKKLEFEASSFRDNVRQPSGPALKKMQALFEKLEHGVYNVSRMRESATSRYKVFNIPTDWMLDSGYVSQIKLASVKLAMKYMKRVSAELETVGSGPEEEELIVQCVRFAFRVHQFAGGFDAETMKAFQELRDKAKSCHIQCQNRQQQKFVCRSTTPC